MNDPAASEDQAASSSILIVKEWYYQSGESYQGPVAPPDIWVLHGTGLITDDTLVWSAVQGGAWRPLRETDVGRPLAAPPSLPPRRYSSVYSWIFAFVPLLGAAVLLAATTIYPALDIQEGWVLLISLAAYMALAALDMKGIREVGADKKTAALTWGVMFPIFYLPLRAKATKTFPSQFIVWIVLIALATYAASIG